MTPARVALWKLAQEEISTAIAHLKTRPRTELETLAGTQRRQIRHGRHCADFEAWSQVDSSGKLGVLVEVREPRFGGLWHTVSAQGFYVDTDGTIQTMQEKDLWENGY